MLAQELAGRRFPQLDAVAFGVHSPAELAELGRLAEIARRPSLRCAARSAPRSAIPLAQRVGLAGLEEDAADAGDAGHRACLSRADFRLEDARAAAGRAAAPAFAARGGRARAAACKGTSSVVVARDLAVPRSRAWRIEPGVLYFSR